MADLQTLNHYEISQNPDGSALELARNHSEVVCLGYDTKNDYFVSFHVIIPEISGRKEFTRRAGEAKKIDHPSLARLLDFGEEEDSYFYVTELVDGEALDSYLDRVDEIPRDLAADLAARVLAAILALKEHAELIPATSTSSFRVFQDTPSSIRVILSEYLLHSTIGHPAKSLDLTKANLERNAEILKAMVGSDKGKGKDKIKAGKFRVLLDELLSEDFREVIVDLESLELELLKFVPKDDVRSVATEIRPEAVLSQEMPDAKQLEETLGPNYSLHVAEEEAGRYAWETQDPGFGRVIAQALPPSRLCSVGGRFAVKKAVTSVTSKDHPHLLRALAMWEGDYPCYIEEPIDSFSLRDLCASREPFQPDELFILLQKLDVALVEAEAAGVARREIIPSDAFFIFFGGKKERDRDLEHLAPIGLDQWPDFQIKLRAHPSGEALAGRRTGMPSRAKEPVALGRLDTRSFVELAFGLLGLPRNPSSDALGDRGLPPRLMRLVKNYWQNEAERSDLDRERFLRAFGAAIAPGQTADEVRKAPVSLASNGDSSASNISSIEDNEPIGLAEALFAGRGIGAPAEGGLPAQNPDSIDPNYLSSPGLPFPVKFIGMLVLSAGLAAAISHVGGGAIWLKDKPNGSGSPIIHKDDPSDPRIEDPKPPNNLPEVNPGGPGGEITIDPPGPITPPDGPEVTPGGGEPNRIRKGPPASLEEALAYYLELRKQSGDSPDSPPSDEFRSLLEEIKNSPDLITEGMEDDLRSAAEWGSPEAMVALAKRYLKSTPAQAFSWFQAAAGVGSGEAHVELGKMYMMGIGTEKSPPQAVRHFMIAADKEEPSAYVLLAECYLDGVGVRQDFSAAIANLTKGVEAGDPEAMYTLGQCYAEGIGVVRNFRRAVDHYSDAYQRGHLESYGSLGTLLMRGHGAEPNPARAAAIFKEGAVKGLADCMHLYAQCLESGSGVRRDIGSAAEWYRKSAKAGYQDAIDWCKERGISF